MKKHIFIAMLLVFAVTRLFAQTYKFTTSTFVYKEVDGTALEMTVYKPVLSSLNKLPAIVFFFGGGWTSGTPNHFKLQAEYLASRGIIAFCPDYRVKNRQGTSPFECVKDARSAMRYVIKHSNQLGVDADKIVAAGGSAGGHLAACTAMIDDINEDTDDLSIEINPFALVLFNPVIDTSKRGYGSEKVKGREFEISPVHHITPGVAPTLIMHGKADTTVPYENVVRFTNIMKQEGNKCKLKGYKKQTHGFFNYSKKPKYFFKCLIQTERFLQKYDLLQGQSWANKYYKQLGE